MKKRTFLSVLCAALSGLTFVMVILAVLIPNSAQAKVNDRETAVCVDCGEKVALDENGCIPARYFCKGYTKPTVYCNGENFENRIVEEEVKQKVRFCTYCGIEAELDENGKVAEGYVCPGSSQMTVADYENKKRDDEDAPAVEATEPDAAEIVEDTETTEPTEENKDELITVACADVKAKFKMQQVQRLQSVKVIFCKNCDTQVETDDDGLLPSGYICKNVLERGTLCFNNADPDHYVFNKKTVSTSLLQLFLDGETTILALIMPVILALCMLAVVVVFLLSQNKAAQGVFALVGGAAAVLTCLCSDIFRQGIWWLIPALALAVGVIGAAMLICSRKKTEN